MAAGSIVTPSTAYSSVWVIFSKTLRHTAIIVASTVQIAQLKYGNEAREFINTCQQKILKSIPVTPDTRDTVSAR